MPWPALGRSISLTLPPSSSMRSSAARQTSATPGSRPSSSRPQAPKRRPSSRSALGARSCRRAHEVESQGSRPSRGRSISAASVTSRVSGPALVERRGERDHPVAADRAVGGLEPDDPAQRRRLADRAAGVGSDRPRRRPAATAAALPPLEPPGTRLAVPRVLDRAEARVLVGRAHGELVLVGLARAPGRRPPGGCARWWRCSRAVALEDARAGRAGHALHAEQVLDRHRRQRPSGSLLGDPEVGAEVVGGCALAPEVEDLLARDLARRELARLLRGAGAEQVAHEAPGLGTRKPPSRGPAPPRARARAAGSDAARPRAGRSGARPRARSARPRRGRACPSARRARGSWTARRACARARRR